MTEIAVAWPNLMCAGLQIGVTPPLWNGDWAYARAGVATREWGVGVLSTPVQVILGVFDRAKAKDGADDIVDAVGDIAMWGEVVCNALL